MLRWLHPVHENIRRGCKCLSHIYTSDTGLQFLLSSAILAVDTCRSLWWWQIGNISFLYTKSHCSVLRPDPLRLCKWAFNIDKVIFTLVMFSCRHFYGHLQAFERAFPLTYHGISAFYEHFLGIYGLFLVHYKVILKHFTGIFAIIRHFPGLFIGILPSF